MSLHQQHLNSLSELERLAELTRLPHLLAQIGAEEWPLAMLACSLHHGIDEQMTAHVRLVYRSFQLEAGIVQRAQSLAVLSNFLSKQKGRAWRALLAYALEDEQAEIRAQAAYLIATLAPEGEAGSDSLERFLGPCALRDYLLREPEAAPTSLLEALFKLADRRIAPLTDALRDQLPLATLLRHLQQLNAIPSQLCFDWLTSLLTHHADQACREHVAACLIRSMRGHDEVIDIITPLPYWKFRQAQPQPLHQWTRREYFERMRHALSPHYDAATLMELEHGFIHA